MKKIPKMLSMALIGLLSAALMLTGCGSQQSPGGSSSQDKVLNIGVDAPLTGPDARSGQEFKDAFDMAFQEVGYKIGDYKVNPVWIDDQSDPVKGSSAYEQAIEKHNIQVGFLNWNSSVAVALMDVVAKYKIPHFFGFGATEVVNQKWSASANAKYWINKGWASPSKLSIAYVDTVNEAVKNGTWQPRNKKVVIYGEDTDWGRAFGTAVGNALKASGWDVVDQEFFKVGETNLYPILTKINSYDPVLVAGTISSAPSVAAFIKQAREVNLKSLMICDGLGYTGDWYKMTGSASDGVLDNVPLFTTDEAKKFAADFQAKYNIVPSAAAAGQVYDYTRFFIEILNGTLKEYGSLTSANLYKYAQENVLTGKTAFDNGVVMKEYKYTPDSAPDPVVGEGEYIFPVVQYFGGKPTVIWPSYEKTAALKIPDYAK